MKKTIKYTLATILLANVTACSNEEVLLKNTQEKKITITAFTPDSNSRVALTDNGGSGISMDWKAGDQFSLLQYKTAPRGENITYTFIDGTNGNFSGNQFTTTGGTFYAVYPTNENFLMPQLLYTDYSIQNGELDEKKTYMCAVSTEMTADTKLQFKHLSAILKPTFKLDGTDITSTLKTIQFLLPDNLHAVTNHDPSTGEFIASNTRSPKFIKVNCNETSLPQSIYIYVPGDALTNGQTIIVGAKDINDNRYEGSITFTKDIEAGKLYTGFVDLEKYDEKYANTDLKTWTTETPITSLLLGNGTSDDPYLIQTASDLQYLVKYPTTHQGMCSRLENDLVIESDNENPWTPIGNDGNIIYEGNFDGNNKTISGNIVCDNTSYAGFFGNKQFGSIKNLTVNANIIAPSSPIQPITNRNNFIYIGGIAGYVIANTIIENCVFIGHIKNHDNTDVNWTQVGGIAGRIDSGVKVKNCTNKGTIVGKNTKEVYVGGIAGGFSNDVVMTGCINEGIVSGTGNPANIGTLAGYAKNANICICNKNTNTDNNPNIGVLGGGNTVQEQVQDCPNQH